MFFHFCNNFIFLKNSLDLLAESEAKQRSIKDELQTLRNGWKHLAKSLNENNYGFQMDVIQGGLFKAQAVIDLFVKQKDVK